MNKQKLLSNIFAWIVLLAACGGSIFAQTASPETTAKAFVAAWSRSDQVAAAKVATATAVKQSFGAKKLILSIRKSEWTLDEDQCKQDEKTWACNFSWDIAAGLFVTVAKVGNDYKVTRFSWFLNGD